VQQLAAQNGRGIVAFSRQACSMLRPAMHLPRLLAVAWPSSSTRASHVLPRCHSLATAGTGALAATSLQMSSSTLAGRLRSKAKVAACALGRSAGQRASAVASAAGAKTKQKAKESATAAAVSIGSRAGEAAARPVARFRQAWNARVLRAGERVSSVSRWLRGAVKWLVGGFVVGSVRPRCHAPDRDLPADRAYVYIRVNLVSPPDHHVLGALLLLQCVQSLLRGFVIVPYMTNDREQ
jgi:hypothetical protein